jgi:D-lyxose ketol-isomerase
LDNIFYKMKRSEINDAIRKAVHAFDRAGWKLPPKPRWDVTDFGLGRFQKFGLILVNLAEEPEYCEKLMFAMHGQATPMHAHKIKKEDIICRHGKLVIEVWPELPNSLQAGAPLAIRRNGETFVARSGQPFVLKAGERVTLPPETYHAFWAENNEGCVIGEVSTANNDAEDNFFVDPLIGRYPQIEEDEQPLVKLLSEP